MWSLALIFSPIDIWTGRGGGRGEGQRRATGWRAQEADPGRTFFLWPLAVVESEWDDLAGLSGVAMSMSLWGGADEPFAAGVVVAARPEADAFWSWAASSSAVSSCRCLRPEVVWIRPCGPPDSRFLPVDEGAEAAALVDEGAEMAAPAPDEVGLSPERTEVGPVDEVGTAPAWRAEGACDVSRGSGMDLPAGRRSQERISRCTLPRATKERDALES